jgi:hypothetical protein
LDLRREVLVQSQPPARTEALFADEPNTQARTDDCATFDEAHERAVSGIVPQSMIDNL